MAGEGAEAFGVGPVLRGPALWADIAAQDGALHPAPRVSQVVPAVDVLCLPIVLAEGAEGFAGGRRCHLWRVGQCRCLFAIAGVLALLWQCGQHGGQPQVVPPHVKCGAVLHPRPLPGVFWGRMWLHVPCPSLEEPGRANHHCLGLAPAPGSRLEPVRLPGRVGVSAPLPLSGYKGVVPEPPRSAATPTTPAFKPPFASSIHSSAALASIPLAAAASEPNPARLGVSAPQGPAAGCSPQSSRIQTAPGTFPNTHGTTPRPEMPFFVDKRGIYIL